jgi:hypothetical protein
MYSFPPPRANRTEFCVTGSLEIFSVKCIYLHPGYDHPMICMHGWPGDFRDFLPRQSSHMCAAASAAMLF